MGWAMTAATAGLSIAQGVMGYQAAQSEKAQYQFNARSELIAANEADARRRGDLLDTLSAIDAIRTSRGLDIASPTGLAIQQGQTKRAEAGIAAERLNYQTRAQSDLFGADIAGYKGDAALLGGFLQAGQSVADYGSTQGWWGRGG